MEKNKKIIRGGTIITMDDATGDIINGAILIEGNRISAISADIQAFDHHTDAQVIDAQGAIVTPGMIDAHRHNWMALFRGVSGGRVVTGISHQYLPCIRRNDDGRQYVCGGSER